MTKGGEDGKVPSILGLEASPCQSTQGIPRADLQEDGGLDGVAYNVGTGVGVSVNLLADTLEGVAGLQPGRNHEAARPGELRHSCLETTRLQGLGWACQWTLEDGLQETYEHIAKGRETA